MAHASVTVNFQEPTLLILAALAGGDLHGYGIIKEVESCPTAGRLSPGTLYGALDRLKNDGLVEIAGEERIDGRLRRYYRLTDAGASALREIDRQERVTQMRARSCAPAALEPASDRPRDPAGGRHEFVAATAGDRLVPDRTIAGGCSAPRCMRGAEAEADPPALVGHNGNRLR